MHMATYNERFVSLCTVSYGDYCLYKAEKKKLL